MITNSPVFASSSSYQSPDDTIMIVDYPGSPFIDGNATVYLSGKTTIIDGATGKEKYQVILVRHMSEKEPNDCPSVYDRMSILTAKGRISSIWHNGVLDGKILMLDSPKTNSQTLLNAKFFFRMTPFVRSSLEEADSTEKTSKLSTDFIKYLQMSEKDRQDYRRTKKEPRSCACTIL